MINRVYMTKERFEEEVKKGNMTHKTYETYLSSVNKIYDDLDSEVSQSDENAYLAEVDEKIDESK